jgi:iron-sulfur cluster assembly protein|tara:strand:+ start:342 stop:689 length:348 start_codon:yes stop_codon:yes gene_type:complete
MEKFSSKELRFSERAISHFSSSLSNNVSSDGIRIGVRKAGCSGFEYFFEFVDANFTNEADFIFDEGDVKIYVDQDSLNYLRGSLVDYSEDGFNQGIKFHNPNAKAVCGCGESFTI